MVQSLTPGLVISAHAVRLLSQTGKGSPLSSIKYDQWKRLVLGVLGYSVVSTVCLDDTVHSVAVCM